MVLWKSEGLSSNAIEINKKRYMCDRINRKEREQKGLVTPVVNDPHFGTYNTMGTWIESPKPIWSSGTLSEVICIRLDPFLPKGGYI
jgi:hypothetical protein